MTKEEVLQKVNDYCTEKQYTTATLTDSFKDKFADHFLKANPEGDVNDENVLKSLKFALNTAFSSASELATVKTTEFTTKENGYKSQIAELQKKVKTPPTPQVEPHIPQEVQDQLKELKAYKDERSRKEKLEQIIALAKKDIRQDLHSEFDVFIKDYEVKDDVAVDEQAKKLHSRFQEIFKAKIGDIKPLAPKATKEQDAELIGSIPKIKI